MGQNQETNEPFVPEQQGPPLYLRMNCVTLVIDIIIIMAVVYNSTCGF